MRADILKCVLLADRHHGLTEGVRGLLATLFQAVVMVADETSLVESAGRLQPNLAVVDLSLARGQSLRWLPQLRASCPHLKLILLSVHDEPSALRAAIEAGADAVVVKRDLATDLLPTVERILAEPSCLASQRTAASAQGSRSRGATEPPADEPRKAGNPQRSGAIPHATESLTVLTFPTSTQALQLQEAMVRLQGESLFELSDAVVVTRDASGKVKIHQSLGAAVAGCVSAGSMAGLIVGAIFAVPWAGSALGAGAGAIVGALSDLGINDRFMKDLGTTLVPGTSALFLLGSGAQLEALRGRIGPLLKDCTLMQTTVNTAREAEIRQLLERCQAASPLESTTHSLP